jgi:uncharacterized membrane protein
VVRSKLAWVFKRGVCFGGLAGALVFFCFSLTPSLLPRGPWLQGLICGVTAVIGYGIGSGLSAAIRHWRSVDSEPAPHVKRIAWWVLLGATVVLVPLFLGLGQSWQNEVRDLMGMDHLEAWQNLTILLVAVLVAALVLVLARFVRGFARVLIRQIDRIMPRKLSVTAGVVLTVVFALGIVQGFILDPLVEGLNSTYSVVNKGTDRGTHRPMEAQRSGSPRSLVSWDSLGVKGRNFVGTGPTQEELTAFNGRQAKEPIRVYVGIESAGALEDRVALAMKELDRTHAWNRKIIAVFTTTGTGWVDKRAADPLEYINNGDTALVALQYSYLPSWISFLVDAQKAEDAGREMIHAVQERLATMPADSRPKLFVFGESLGSYGTEAAFANVDTMIDGVDGALLAGPVFRNPIHNAVTADREKGTTRWLPVYQNGEHVRFAVSPSDLEMPDSEWKSPRTVYLQNATDPITYWKLDLLWSKPDWLDDPRGPDVSPSMQWVPVVTWWQTLADMAFSTGVPQGHGHNYGANQADAWAAIYHPPSWTAAKTRELHRMLARDGY